MAEDLTTAEIVRKVEPSLVCVKTPTSAGSGFVVGDPGIVITNAHVVERESSPMIEFVNGATVKGFVYGRDEDLDVASVTLPHRTSRLKEQVDVIPLSLGDSDATMVGEEVLALGFPLSEVLKGSPTVTRGIISAKRPGSLQTDAAINPGNSGGPLVNARGEVIGVNTSVIDMAHGRNIEGIGFAVPINDFKSDFFPLHRDTQARIGSSAVGYDEWKTWSLMARRLYLSLSPDWKLLNRHESHASFRSGDATFYLHLWGIYSTVEYELLNDDSLLKSTAEVWFGDLASVPEEEGWIEFAVTSNGFEWTSDGVSCGYSYSGKREYADEQTVGRKCLYRVRSESGIVRLLMAVLETTPGGSYDTQELEQMLSSYLDTALLMEG